MLMRRRYKGPPLEMEGSRYKSLDLARGRLALVSAVILIAYTLLALRLAEISLFGLLNQSPAAQERILETAEYDVSPGVQAATLNKNAALSSSIYSSAPADSGKSAISAHRGVRADITDRNGILLARSLLVSSLYADPALIQNADITSEALAKVFAGQAGKADKEVWRQKITRKGRFVWLKRHLSPEEMQAVLRIGDPGLGFREEYRRVYPQVSLPAHVTGYTDIDGRGIAGIEKSANTRMRTQEEPLRLTLDIRIQHAARKALGKAVVKHEAQAGAAVVMDIRNGDVLAAVSWPDFDPNRLSESTEAERFNRISRGLYELGSTFKIFSTAAYLEMEGAAYTSLFDVRRPLRKYGHTINDYHGKKTILTLPEVFIHSSNIGSALMGEAVGTSRLKKIFSDLGLTRKLPLSLIENAQPLLPEPWREMNTLTAAYGHGMAVTPLHFTAAAAAIVNNGIYIPPRMVMEDGNVSADKGKKDERIGIRVVSKQTSQKMRRLMRLVVTHGTGTQAEVPGYLVGGKTGTAEKSIAGGYSSEKLISSFFGVFPSDKPRYAVFVMLDEPKGIAQTYGYATGGWVAAPAVGEVISAMGRILGIEKNIYADDHFLAGLQNLVRTDEDFERRKKEKAAGTAFTLPLPAVARRKSERNREDAQDVKIEPGAGAHIERGVKKTDVRVDVKPGAALTEKGESVASY